MTASEGPDGSRMRTRARASEQVESNRVVTSHTDTRISRKKEERTWSAPFPEILNKGVVLTGSADDCKCKHARPTRHDDRAHRKIETGEARDRRHEDWYARLGIDLGDDRSSSWIGHC